MKLKCTLAAAVLLGLVVFSSAGTDTAKKLVGVWELTKTTGKPAKGKSLIEFTADGKFINDETSEKSNKIRQEGTYTAKEGVVTMLLDKKIKIVDKELAITITIKIKKLTETELHVELGPLTGSKDSVFMEHKRVKK
ncbi:MAG: hypothetical protein EXS16_06290 [Gemmataceae bacterium]|nr:hypothetical protein [Gemmataceae bacterium]